MGTLYIVATPLGNLEDITYRAVRILKEVPLIAAEDTRTAKVLRDHYQITTPLISFHDFSSTQKLQELLAKLLEGDLALISDAGTPGINDPGYNLVRAALAENHQVVPVPGPSAPIAALSASGQAPDAFHYFGYLPRKSKARQDLLNEVKSCSSTLIFLETPHRLVESLEDILAVLGDRKMTAAREMTKIHEEFARGQVDQVLDHFTREKPRGEITLVIEGADEEDLKWTEGKVLAALQKAQQARESSPSQISKEIARKSGWPRRVIYDLLNDLK